MTILGSLLKRGLTPTQVWGAGLDDLYRGDTAAGINVTAERAMQSANGKCIRLLADDIAQLPIDFYRKVGDQSVPIPPASWYAEPTTNRWDTWPDHITQVVVSLLSDGNAFVQGLPNVMDPEYLYVLDPSHVEVKIRAGLTSTLYNGNLLDDGTVAHLKWVTMPGALRGLNVVEASKESTGLELAAREWAASFFANGATLSGYIKSPTSLPKEAVDNLRDTFAAKHVGRRKSHAFGVLTGGAEFKELTINPQQAELGPLWQHVLEEAAALYHIPPHMLGSQVSGGQAYASVEQKSIDYVVHAIVPILRRLEAVYSRFIPGDDTFLKFNEKALMRGDFESQARGFRTYLETKVIRRDEVRAKLDLPPDPDAQGFLETPNNNAPADAPSRGAALVLNAENVHTESMTLDGAPLAPLIERQNQLMDEQRTAIRSIADRPDPVIRVAPPIVTVQERALPDSMAVVVINEPRVHVKSAPKRRIVKDSQGKPEAAVDG